MNSTVDAVVIALLVINLIGLLVIGVKVSGQSRENQDLEKRMTRLEARVDNLPTHRDLTVLGRDISEVVTTCAEIDGRTEAMAQTLRTIQDHLLESDR